MLVAHGNTVTLVDAEAANDQELQHGPIRRMAVAPNGQFLAAFTDEGKLIVWTADFGKFLSEFATQSDNPPEQLAWCGTDSVVLFWEVSWLQDPLGLVHLLLSGERLCRTRMLPGPRCCHE